jgi:hypothetical protein
MIDQCLLDMISCIMAEVEFEAFTFSFTIVKRSIQWIDDSFIDPLMDQRLTL